MEVDQVRFMQSKHNTGYDMAITSLNGNSILFLDLKTAQTDMLEG